MYGWLCEYACIIWLVWLVWPVGGTALDGQALGRSTCMALAWFPSYVFGAHAGSWFVDAPPTVASEVGKKEKLVGVNQLGERSANAFVTESTPQKY